MQIVNLAAALTEETRGLIPRWKISSKLVLKLVGTVQDPRIDMSAFVACTCFVLGTAI